MANLGGDEKTSEMKEEVAATEISGKGEITTETSPTHNEVR